LWTSFFGYSEGIVRLFSALFGIGTVILCYKLGKEIFNQEVGLWTSLLISLSPFHIWYAQEARSYSLSSFLILTSVYLLIIALKRDKLKYWLGYFIISTLSFYTSYIYFIVLPLEVLIFLRNFRRQFKKWLFCFLLTLILFLPSIKIFFAQFKSTLSCFWIPKPDIKDIQFSFENFNLGYTAFDNLYLVSWFIWGSLYVVGLFQAKEKKGFIYLFASFLFFSMGFIYFFSHYTISLYIDRLFLPLTIFYYFTIVWGLYRIKFRFLRFSFMILMVVFSLVSIYNYFTDYINPNLSHHTGLYLKKPVWPIVKFIERNWQDRDYIIYTNPGIAIPCSYYFERDFFNKRFPYNLNSDLNSSYVIDQNSQDSYWFKILKDKRDVVMLSKFHPLTHKYRRFWLIGSSWARDYTLDENSIQVKKFMDSNFKKIFQYWFNGSLVALYEKHENKIDLNNEERYY
jgi:hypothetical protein